MAQPILPPLLREGTEGALRDLADRKNLEEMYIQQGGTDAWERKAGDDEPDPERLRRVTALTYGELLDQPENDPADAENWRLTLSGRLVSGWRKKISGEL